MIKQIITVILCAALIVSQELTLCAQYRECLAAPSLAEINADGEVIDIYTPRNEIPKIKDSISGWLMNFLIISTITLTAASIAAQFITCLFPIHEVLILIGISFLVFSLNKIPFYAKLPKTAKSRFDIFMITVPLILYLAHSWSFVNTIAVHANNKDIKTFLVKQLQQMPKNALDGLWFVGYGKSVYPLTSMIGGKYFKSPARIMISNNGDTLQDITDALYHDIGEIYYENLPEEIKDKLAYYHINYNEDFSFFGPYAQYEVLEVTHVIDKNELEKLRDSNRLFNKAGGEAFPIAFALWESRSDQLFMYTTPTESIALKYFIEQAAAGYTFPKNGAHYCRFFYPKFLDRDYKDVQVSGKNPSYEELQKACFSSLPMDTIDKSHESLDSLLSYLYGNSYVKHECLENLYRDILPEARVFWSTLALPQKNMPTVYTINFIRGYLNQYLIFDNIRQDVKDRFSELSGAMPEQAEKLFKYYLARSLKVNDKPLGDPIINFMRQMLIDSPVKIFKVFEPLIDSSGNIPIKKPSRDLQKSP